jgi:hypothetical protein
MSLVIEGRKSRVGRSPRIDYLARIGIDHEGRCRGLEFGQVGTAEPKKYPTRLEGSRTPRTPRNP